jgi:hypothetical protein
MRAENDGAALRANGRRAARPHLVGATLPVARLCGARPARRLILEPEVHMRASSVRVMPAALLAVACARVPPLQAVDPAQAIDGAPNEAQAEIAGVTVHATIGGWRGEPRSLEQQLTPIDVTVLNGSNRVIRLGPEVFSLQTPSGPQRALTQSEAAWMLRDLAERRDDRYGPRVGAIGQPAFPGYDQPGSTPWQRSPRGTPTPSLAQWYEQQPASGTLRPGGKTSIMLFFGTPTRTLATATFQVELVDAEGGELGMVRLPFARD